MDNIKTYDALSAYTEDIPNFKYPHVSYIKGDGNVIYNKSIGDFYDVVGTAVPGTTGITMTYFYTGETNVTETIPVDEKGRFYVNFDKTKTIGALYLSGTPIVTIEKLGVKKIQSLSNAFKNCTALTSVNMSELDGSLLTGLGNMFYNCSSLTSLTGYEDLNTSGVTGMDQMIGATKITSLDLSKWSTLGVNINNGIGWTPWKSCNTIASIDISGWNIDLVRTDVYPFNLCHALRDIYMENTSDATFGKIKNGLTNTSIHSAAIHRDGLKWHFDTRNYVWVSEPDV